MTTGRTFVDRPAVRAHVPLLVGLMGPSGSGKTFSALRLATGIQKISGGEIFVIDTESKRALHYADMFKFRHIEFTAPFGSSDYFDAIGYCVAKGAGVIIVDSMTHEHAGEGGYLQLQESEADRMAKAPPVGEGEAAYLAKRERVKFAAWIKPSKLRQQFITSLSQLNSNFIFCFRAKEKIKPVAGKQPLEMGFMPIAGEELLFEMTVNCLLLPKAGGVPTWRSDHIGEKLMMKCPVQFEPMFAGDKPLDEATGQGLAEWARGGAREEPPAAIPDIFGMLEAGNLWAKQGLEPLEAFWKALGPALRQQIGTAQLETWKQEAKDIVK